MRRTMFKAKLHRVTITEANLNYEGSITIDEALMRAADILPYEQVHVWNVSNGSRLQTYAIPGAAGSGIVCLNGSAARHAQPGDLAIVATFAEVEEVELAGWQPRIVHVDADNRPRLVKADERPRTRAAG